MIDAFELKWKWKIISSIMILLLLRICPIFVGSPFCKKMNIKIIIFADIRYRKFVLLSLLEKENFVYGLHKNHLLQFQFKSRVYIINLRPKKGVWFWERKTVYCDLRFLRLNLSSSSTTEKGVHDSIMSEHIKEMAALRRT